MMRGLETGKERIRWPFVLFFCALLLLSTAPWAQEEPPPPKPDAPMENPPDTEALEGEEFQFEPAPEPAIPPEYLQGRGYLGNFPDAWVMERLFDPVNARLFLAIQNGAGREALSKLEIPDLNLALDDLISGRMVRESAGIYRPAFPLIREGARQSFAEAIQSTANRAYASLRPTLQKIQKEASRGKLLPWLYALVWTEMLESRRAENALVDAGALDRRRLRDEGYLWVLIPADSYATGEERYGSGSETLHYLWTLPSPIHPALQDFAIRRRLLDTALAGSSWDDEETRETLEATGILDPEKHVRVPVLRNKSHLLKAVRKASRAYVKDFLRNLNVDALARALQASREETFASAFACTGFRVLDMAVRDGLLSRPDYLSREEAPMIGLVETMVITEDEQFDPMERAYYFYDREDFGDAIRMADTFLQSHPGDSEALFRKGISLMKLRKYPEALQVFQQAASRPAKREDVWRAWILIRAGNVLDVMRRRDEAMRKYTEALGFADVAGSQDSARTWLENVYQD